MKCEERGKLLFMVASSLLSCHITLAMLQGIPGRWKNTAYNVQHALKPTVRWGKIWHITWSSIFYLVWELLLGLDLMPPHTAALQCTQSSYTLRRSCPSDQRAHVIHPETLTSDKKETGACGWQQGTLYLSKSSPSDSLNCALLQLLENQDCWREKMELRLSWIFSLKHLQQCWQILLPSFINSYSIILM